MTTVAAEYEHMEIQQQYNDGVNNRWDDDWDNENSSARLFERSRIKALAGDMPENTKPAVSMETMSDLLTVRSVWRSVGGRPGAALTC
ncbi:hypothetical protein NQD34_011019 [Periophthalmus magnuspinnatus]|nr:hypothetical protein NQD34_011019 [Periophthalmus magnuspinnatus]